MNDFGRNYVHFTKDFRATLPRISVKKLGHSGMSQNQNPL